MDHRSESSSLALSWLLEQEVIIFCPVAKIKRWYLIFLQTTDIFTFLCLYKTCRSRWHYMFMTWLSHLEVEKELCWSYRACILTFISVTPLDIFKDILDPFPAVFLTGSWDMSIVFVAKKKCVFHKTSVHLQTFIVATNLFFSFPNWFLCFTRNWKLNLNKCKVATWIVVGRNIHHQSVSCRLSCLRNTLVATQHTYNLKYTLLYCLFYT